MVSWKSAEEHRGVDQSNYDRGTRKYPHHWQLSSTTGSYSADVPDQPVLQGPPTSSPELLSYITSAR